MNKRNIIIMVCMLTFILLIGGVSYSYFVYNRNIGNITVNAGEISIDLSNINGNQTLTDVIPLTDYDGMNSSNYFDFTVNGTVDTERIYYEVYIAPDENNTLDTSHLKVYLTDQNDVKIQNVKFYNDLGNIEDGNGKVLYQGIIETDNGVTRSESKDFRLRIWIDDTYSELTSKTFSFDIYLNAKNVDDEFDIEISS